MRSYFSFQWHITDECDQRCKHCYIFSGEGCKELKSMTSARYTTGFRISISPAAILSFIPISGN